GVPGGTWGFATGPPCRPRWPRFSARPEIPPAWRRSAPWYRGTARVRRDWPPRCVQDRRSLLRQPLSHPNERCRHRLGVAPVILAIAVGEVKGQRRRVGVDDDFGPAEAARGVFREAQQNAAVALPL